VYIDNGNVAIVFETTEYWFKNYYYVWRLFVSNQHVHFGNLP